MRKSREETAETRRRIVEAASREFRAKGIDGTGIADLMAVAGLTQGGFYRHFESKEQLVEEAMALASGYLAQAIQARSADAPGGLGLTAALTDYLSSAHRDNMAGGCPFVALGSEVARGSDGVRQATTEGILELADVIAAKLDARTPAAAKKEALVTIATMIGAMTMARIVTDPKLSATILREATKQLTKSEV